MPEVKLTPAEKTYYGCKDRIAWLKRRFPGIKILMAEDSSSPNIRVSVLADQPIRGFHTMPESFIPKRAGFRFPKIEEGDSLRVKGKIKFCKNGFHGAETLRAVKDNWDYGPIASSCLFWGTGEISVRNSYSNGARFYVSKWVFRHRKHVAMVNTMVTERRVSLGMALKETKEKSKRAKILAMMKNPMDPTYGNFYFHSKVQFHYAPIGQFVKRIRDQLRRRVKKLTTNKVEVQKESA